MLGSITKATIPNTFLWKFVIMLFIRIYAFLLALGQLNYYTTRDSLSVYLRCDKAGFQISNSIIWDVKNSSDLRVSSFHVFLKSRPMHHGMPNKNLSCRSTPFQMNLVMIILLSGDVQLNPGPPTRTPKYPCGVCSKNANSSQKAMECEDCLTWYHIKCVNMGDNMYQVHMHHNSYTWVCIKCGLPNFTNSSLFTTFTVCSSFKLLADLPNDSSIIPPVPVSSRGPQCTSIPKKRRNTHDNKKLYKQCNRSNRLKMINLNFQSLRIKIPQYQALLEIEKHDIVVGSETWLDQSILASEIMPTTYQMFRRDRQMRTNSGGVLLAIHSNLITRKELHLETNG